jgi:hypothetical protein
MVAPEWSLLGLLRRWCCVGCRGRDSGAAANGVRVVACKLQTKTNVRIFIRMTQSLNYSITYNSTRSLTTQSMFFAHSLLLAGASSMCDLSGDWSNGLAASSHIQFFQSSGQVSESVVKSTSGASRSNAFFYCTSY